MRNMLYVGDSATAATNTLVRTHTYTHTHTHITAERGLAKVSKSAFPNVGGINNGAGNVRIYDFGDLNWKTRPSLTPSK